MGKIDKNIFNQRQHLPFECKIALSENRIRAWYEYYTGDVYIAFSGGKDSTVLRSLIKKLYPHVPAVFCDTGLEYPEIRSFALKYADYVIKPKMNFKNVIEKYGYPIIGKKQARMIRDLQNETDKNFNVCNLHRTGYTSKGLYCPQYKLAEKWFYLIDAPFKVSEQCCDIMKKKPFALYEKETGYKPFIGTLACDSQLRKNKYIEYGCNAFELKHPRSTPLGFWTEQDILKYIKTNNIEYAEVYGNIEENENGLFLTGEQHTGCMFCMFGIQFEKDKNRFQRMKEKYPKQYKYCIEKLNIDLVLDYMGIKYR